MLRESEGGERRESEGGREKREEPAGARAGEDKRDEERCDDGGEATKASSGTRACATQVCGVELWAHGVERAPRAEVDLT